MRVQALKVGFDGVALRQEGEEFDLPDMIYVLDPRSGQRVKDENGKDKMTPFVRRADDWFIPVDEIEEAPKARHKRG